MSQNPPRGSYDNDFLNENVDLEIAHPSPNAEIYTRTSSSRLPPAPLLVAGFALFAIFAGGVYFYAYQQGLQEGQRSLPPVVLAESDPIKVPAEQLPEGQIEEPRPLNIHDVANGKADMPALGGEIVEAGPADNATGTIESLITESIAKNEEASVGERLANRPETGVQVSPPRPDLNRAPKAETSSEPPAPAQAIARPMPKPAAEPKPEPAAEPVAQATPAPEPTTTPAPAPAPDAVPAARQDYMVQLAASRSRALARSVYTRLQGEYDDLLGRRDPFILRVDLGDRGIFYRVNVAGFATKAAADSFCADLKKRGQDCLVRRQP
ncbi:MAG: SPOR domain-containing protein [Parvibaculales bacterium]